MLFIVSKNRADIALRVGGKFPNISWDAVTEIQADGHELTVLYLIFPDLPKCRLRVVTFIGETAKFIAANLADKTFQSDAS